MSHNRESNITTSRHIRNMLYDNNELFHVRLVNHFYPIILCLDYTEQRQVTTTRTGWINLSCGPQHYHHLAGIHGISTILPSFIS